MKKILLAMTVCAMILYVNLAIQKYLDGPEATQKTLVKAATLEQYSQAVLPCPGYAKPTIVRSSNGDLLGDCDGDGHVDEMASEPPTNSGLSSWPYKKQWRFTPRTGVDTITLKDGKPFAGAVTYPPKGFYSHKFQMEFLWLKIFGSHPEKTKSPSTLARACGRPPWSPVFLFHIFYCQNQF